MTFSSAVEHKINLSTIYQITRWKFLLIGSLLTIKASMKYVKSADVIIIYFNDWKKIIIFFYTIKLYTMNKYIYIHPLLTNLFVLSSFCSWRDVKKSIKIIRTIKTPKEKFRQSMVVTS